MPSDDAIFLLKVCFVVVMIIAAPVAFILIQIKARAVWRLISLAVVLVGSCWACSYYTHFTDLARYSDTYVRGCHEFVDAIDQMAIEGHTNDVHQSCQKFEDVFYLSLDKRDVTNFDQFVANTYALASEQPNTAPKPTPTAP